MNKCGYSVSISYKCETETLPLLRREFYETDFLGGYLFLVRGAKSAHLDSGKLSSTKFSIAALAGCVGAHWLSQ
eukprot:COSAG02_NODE_12667_length_1512_cov_1.455060_3_plen_73_part_01